MVIFTITVTAVAGVLVGAADLTRNNAQRVVAANLARQQIEVVRSQRALDIPDGLTQPVPDVTLDGTTFTVSQEAGYLTSGAAASLCAGTGNDLAFKRVSITVAWTNMASSAPMRADTVVALGLNGDGIAASQGAVAALVQDAAGRPRPGISVTLSPGGAVQTTTSDGCAVFSGLTPGTYAVALNQAPYVGIDSAQALVSGSLTVTPSTVTRTILDYDLRGSLAVAVTAPAGYTSPAPVPLTLDFALFTPSTSRPFPDCVSAPAAQCVSGTPRRTDSLFPGSYRAWAGTCADARPSPPPTLVDVRSGVSSTTSTALGGVDVEIEAKRNNVPARAYAIHLRDSLCTSLVSYPLPPGANLKVALPRGTWMFALTPDGSTPPGGGWPTQTIVPGAVANKVKVK